MAPKTHFPKLLLSDSAKKKADLFLIQKDLEHTRKCCDLIVKKGIDPILETEARALLDSALIRYRRCFGKGKRAKINLDFIDSLGGDAVDLHNFCKNLADKHIAHPVNAFELYGIVLYVAINKEGKITHRSLGGQGFHTLEFNLSDIENFQILVTALIDKITNQINHIDEFLNDEIAAMTDEEILNLPDGFPPSDSSIDVTKPKNWPPTTT